MLYSVDRLTRDVGCYFSVLGIYFAHTTERKILRMKFNEKLIEIRKKQGLSQEELGMELQVSRQTISKWETGVSVPNINTLILISEKFDIPVDEMLKSGYVVEKIDNNKTSFKKDRNYSIVFLTIGILGLISIPFEMSADDHNCTSHFGHNCTSHFGVDAFCLALHGADLHIQSGA